MSTHDQMQILGVPISHLPVAELHDRIATYIQQDERALVLNVNVNCLNLAYQYPWLRSFLSSAQIVFCDGAGVVLGMRLLGHTVPGRITYADWIWQLAEFATLQDFRFFFLGGRPGIAQKAVMRLHERFPQMRISGVQHGYFDKTPGSPENKAVIQQINAVQPDILVVALGMPLQERWLMENWEHLNANVALTGGAVLDYVSGELHRAPRWMTDNGLEWFGRLIIEPRRLWRRYLIGNPLFLWRVVKQRAKLERF